MSALRNKDNQLFRILVEPFSEDYLLIIVLSHPAGTGHPGQAGHCIKLSVYSILPFIDT